MARTIEANPNILWLPVCGLALMQGAITLCWVIYNLYIPQLLVEIGFNSELAIGLLIFENALAVIIEPLMGGLSDNAKRWVTSRFSFITAGVILSSTLFITIPTTVTFLPNEEATRWIFLFVVVGWSIAMAVFRSPTIALLGKCAANPNLPLAASFLTVTGGIITAFRPFSSNFLLSMGAVFTFSVGSFVLLGAAFVLRFVNPPEKPVVEITEVANISQQLPKALFLLLGTGFGVAWGSRLLMDFLSKLLAVELNTNSIDGIMFIISLSLAFAALPAGAFATKIGNRKAMVWSSCVISILMLFILLFGAKLILIILVVGAFSLIINGAVPLALSLASPQRAGLAVGMYFSGIALGTSLLSSTFPKLATIPPLPEMFIGAMAFLAVGTCVTVSYSINQVVARS